MKTILLSLTLLIALSSFSQQSKPGEQTAGNGKATAVANQYQGLYVYTDSKPVAQYEYLGTVKAKGAAWGSGQYTDLRDRFIKAAKKEYPNADAIILYLQDGGTDRADVIKFKQ